MDVKKVGLPCAVGKQTRHNPLNRHIDLNEKISALHIPPRNWWSYCPDFQPLHLSLFVSSSSMTVHYSGNWNKKRIQFVHKA
ncbi:hypothetical protein Q5O89_12800 [Peribacillus frigoritolerans]|nr:hypothetical protein [Peribacillus frigoritolerans]